MDMRGVSKGKCKKHECDILKRDQDKCCQVCKKLSDCIKRKIDYCKLDNSNCGYYHAWNTTKLGKPIQRVYKIRKKNSRGTNRMGKNIWKGENGKG